MLHGSFRAGTIYARLWTIDGFMWESQDFQYTAATGGNSGPAQITLPVPDSTLSGNSIEFIWDDLGGTTEYWLEVGSTQGNADYYGQSDTTAETSATVTGLPADGSIIHARLWTIANGIWQFEDFQFTSGP